MRYSLPPSDSNQAASLTSMIDIIFLLIIFFVVTASMDGDQLDLTVIPPKISGGIETKALPPDRLMINIQEDGTVRLGYRTLTADSIKTELATVLRDLNVNANTVLIVNGAELCPHKYIATVLETAAGTGFDQVRINAEILPPEELEIQE